LRWKRAREKLCNRLFIFSDEFSLSSFIFFSWKFEPSRKFNNLNKFEFLWKFALDSERETRGARARERQREKPKNNFSSFRGELRQGHSLMELISE
jgi:hypothetical protein